MTQIEERKHLNDSLPVQYGYWVKDAVTNKFGTPLLQPGNRIWDDLRRVIPHTLQLVFLAEILALLLGVGIGVYSAIRQYSVFDYTRDHVKFPRLRHARVLAGADAPGPVHEHLPEVERQDLLHLAVSSSEDAGGGIHFVIDRLQHLAIPAMTLMVISIAQYSRFMRASMLEVINSDYVRTARAKGLIGAEGDAQARLAERADPGRDGLRARTSAP